MLILTRTPGQKIILSNDIICVVKDICGNQVRLGFEAPKHIQIDREEILRRKAQQGLVILPEVMRLQ